MFSRSFAQYGHVATSNVNKSQKYGWWTAEKIKLKLNYHNKCNKFLTKLFTWIHKRNKREIETETET